MSGILTAFTGGAFATLVLDISNRASPDIPALLSAAGWLGTGQPVRLVNTGNVNTLVIPSSLYGASIYLLNGVSARIGGAKNGGTALRTQILITVENLCVISGGGGRGGDGGGATAAYDPPTYASATSGVAGGNGGDGQGFDSTSVLTISSAVTGTLGTTDTLYGGPVSGGASHVTHLAGGKGGDGGGWGTAGGAGTNGSVYGDTPSRQTIITGNPGGLAGIAVDGNDKVNWAAVGTRIGRIT